MSRPRPRTYDRPQRPPAAEPRPCDHPGCRETGEFRAPRSRQSLNDFYWFCLEHVRSYNASWDFYRGMSATEIEASRRADIVGNRPTWPLGQRGPQNHDLGNEALRQAFRRFYVFEEEEAPRTKRPPTPEEEALAVLELAPGADLPAVKARYKALVKRHHPDANGGDKAAEERLKLINQAYTFLKNLRRQGTAQDAAD